MDQSHNDSMNQWFSSSQPGVTIRRCGMGDVSIFRNVPNVRRGGDVPWQRKLRKSAFGSRAGTSTSWIGKGTSREPEWREVASAAAAAAAVAVDDVGNGE